MATRTTMCLVFFSTQVHDFTSKSSDYGNFFKKILGCSFFAVRLNNEYIPSIASIKLEIKKVYTGNSSSIWNLSTYHGLSVLFKRDVKLIILIRVVKTDIVTKEHTPFSFKVSSINVYRLTTRTISLFFSFFWYSETWHTFMRRFYLISKLSPSVFCFFNNGTHGG